MMAEMLYTGNLRCEIKHVKSGTVIETDAPVDNKGKGEKFSPTDVLCVSLATCMITTMGIRADDMNIDLTGAKASITKHMAASPRRVAKVEVEITLPGSGISDKDKEILQKIGDTCPVAQSLSPEVEVIAVYIWA